MRLGIRVFPNNAGSFGRLRFEIDDGWANAETVGEMGERDDE